MATIDEIIKLKAKIAVAEAQLDNLVSLRADESKHTKVKSFSFYHDEVIRVDKLLSLEKERLIGLEKDIRTREIKAASNAAPFQGNVALFWDYENVQLPARADLVLGFSALRDGLQRHGYIVQHFNMFGADKHLNAKSKKNLGDLGVRIFDTSARVKENADDMIIIVEIMSFAIENPNSCIILISSDSDYAFCLSKLRGLRYKTVVIVKNNVSTALCSAAETCLRFHDLIDPAHAFAVPTVTTMKNSSSSQKPNEQKSESDMGKLTTTRLNSNATLTSLRLLTLGDTELAVPVSSVANDVKTRFPGVTSNDVLDVINQNPQVFRRHDSTQHDNDLLEFDAVSINSENISDITRSVSVQARLVLDVISWTGNNAMKMSMLGTHLKERGMDRTTRQTAIEEAQERGLVVLTGSLGLAEIALTDVGVLAQSSLANVQIEFPLSSLQLDAVDPTES